MGGADRYGVYRRAVDMLETRGWIRGKLESPEGVCLVGSVAYSVPTGVPSVSREVEREINRYLLRYPGYHVLRGVTWVLTRFMPKYRARWRLGAMQAWNDVPWRRKRAVVRVLKSLADACEPEWFKDEALRLSAECSALRLEVASLKERIVALEEENRGLMRKIRRMSVLEADRRQLAEVEAQLAKKWEELQVVERTS